MRIQMVRTKEIEKEGKRTKRIARKVKSGKKSQNPVTPRDEVGIAKVDRKLSRAQVKVTETVIVVVIVEVVVAAAILEVEIKEEARVQLRKKVWRCLLVPQSCRQNCWNSCG